MPDSYFIESSDTRVPLPLAFIIVVLVFAVTSQQSCGQTPGMIEFFSSGKTRKGMALVDLTGEMIVLGRDGSMHSLDPINDQSIKRVSGTYTPASAAELRNNLRAEYGRNYEVIATKNFLVVQPTNRGNRWPNLFEQSHRAFTTYMTRRGVNVRKGRFPMVAVVFPDQKAMYSEFKRMKIDVSRVSGVYSNDSNRVLTHDGGHAELIAATVRHEAAHQSAFNSGIHSRVVDTPKWITEGIGQMFERPAMVSSGGGSQIRERANTDSMRVIKAKLSGRNEEKYYQHVVQLIGDDTMFENDKSVDKAYAVSWSMMFYLAERQPREFGKLLNHTASRPPFRKYDRIDRIKDFEKIVGVEMFEFAKRVRRFIESL